MYKCRDCEKIFDEENVMEIVETHGLECPPYEVWCACPHCHSSDFEEAEMCEICGSYEFSEDIYDGVCESCAKNAITYELALEYIKEKSSLAEFFLCFYYGTANRVEVNRSLEIELEKIYKAKIDSDVQRGRRVFLNDIKEYMFNDLCEWSKFLKRKEIKNEDTKN